MSIALDGMDQFPHGFPHFRQKQKNDGIGMRLKVHTQIAMAHGRPPLVFVAKLLHVSGKVFTQENRRPLMAVCRICVEQSAGMPSVFLLYLSQDMSVRRAECQALATFLAVPTMAEFRIKRRWR